jgi:transcriptional regulator with XRE-family HTH domain
MAARDALAARRKAVGLTQEALADVLRVERSTVARWEQGSATPRPWYRPRLADALSLTPDELARLIDDDAAFTTRDRYRNTEPVSPWDGESVRTSGEPADADYVQSIRANARRLIDLDTSYGGDDLARLAAERSILPTNVWPVACMYPALSATSRLL